MSLNWAIKDVTDFEDLLNDADARITEDLVWSTLPVGIPEITEENWRSFAVRLHIWETLHGFEHLPPAEVERRIGLTTNASPLTDARFRANMFRILREKAQAALSAG